MTLKEELAELVTCAPKASPETRRRIDEMIADLDARRVAANAVAEGEIVPDFILPSAAGDRFSLEAQALRGPVVLMFYRGSWCPYCIEQLHDLAGLMPAFADAGATVAAIAPAAAPAPAERLLGFPLLTDHGNRVARLYGLAWRIPADVALLYVRRGIDLPALNGTRDWQLPLAASYVVDRDHVARFAAIDVDYRARGSLDRLLAVARQLGAGGHA